MATTLKTKSTPSPKSIQKLKRAKKLFDQGNYIQAGKAYSEIIQAGANDPDIILKYGICLYQNTLLAEAVSTLESLKKTHPSSAVFCALGNAYNKMGETGEVKKAYETAISLDQNNDDAWYRMAMYYFAQNEQDRAILIMSKAREIAHAKKSETEELYEHYLSHFFKGTRIVKFNATYKKLILDGLCSKNSIRENFTRAWLQVLELDESLFPVLKTLAKTPLEKIEDVIEANKDACIFTDPYFYNGIEKLNILNPDMEDICRKIRRYFLEAISKNKFHKPHSRLLFAMAVQCFFNEYLFSFDEKESEIFRNILNEIENNNLENIDNLNVKLAITGCYQPLYLLKNPEGILEFIARHGNNDDAFSNLLKVQISEPLQEAKIKNNLTSLSDIADEVSKKVRNQYEEMPYPRWQHFAQIDSRKHNALKQPVPIGFKCKELLIAGCGTGRQILIQNQAMPDAKITAIDISKTSLAYAKRKCQEAGLKNVKFYHADILDLEKMGKSFDWISCAGVLHHMRDPFSGWQILSKILKPGGYMDIGLYSEAARQDVIAAREMISQMGFKDTAEGIRACREHIKENERQGKMRDLLTNRDFYYLSGTKDLIFHVQEHRYTIPEIKETLEKLGLLFTRMVFSSITSNNDYKKMFPKDIYLEKLDNFEKFEERYPRTFASMYNFWVHKPLKN